MVYLVLTCRALLIGTFALSSVSKSSPRRLREFARSLIAMRLVRGSAALPLAGMVLSVEFMVVMLLAAPFRFVGFAAAGGVLVALSVGIATALRRGAATACRCFGRSQTNLARRHVVRNVGLTAVAVAGLAASVPHSGEFHPAGAVVALAGALFGLMVIRFFDEIAVAFSISSPIRR